MQVRSIIAPANVQAPADARASVYPMFDGPKGQWIVNVRWQGRDFVSAVSGYNAASETGFVVPSPVTDWQFGPPGKTGRRSTYQVNGVGVGILSLTDDSPELSQHVPAAPPAASKHVSYGYTFATPRPVFRGTPMWALMFQARLSVPKFKALDRVSGTPGEIEQPLGTLYWVAQFVDQRTGP